MSSSFFSRLQTTFALRQGFEPLPDCGEVFSQKPGFWLPARPVMLMGDGRSDLGIHHRMNHQQSKLIPQYFAQYLNPSSE
jgi:hypothetical protein